MLINYLINTLQNRANIRHSSQVLQLYHKTLTETRKLHASIPRVKKCRVWTISDLEFMEIVNSSNTQIEIFTKLGYTQFSGEVFNNIKKRMLSLGIDNTHLEKGAEKVWRG